MFKIIRRWRVSDMEPTFNRHEPMVCPDCKEARTLQNRKRPQLVRSRCLQPSPSVTVAAFIVIAFVLFPRRTTDRDKVKHLPQIDAVQHSGMTPSVTGLS
jgi:hypothetical protein